MGRTKDKSKNKIGIAALSKSKPDRLINSPTLKFILFFILLMILFYAIWLSSFFNNAINPFICNTYAFLGSKILNILQQGTTITKNVISSPYFSIAVNRGCDAIEASAIFVAALLAFPAKWKQKLKGLIKGLLILSVVNLVRIVSLFFIGKYYPDYFEFVHVDMWQIIFIILALGLWLGWVKTISPIKIASEK